MDKSKSKVECCVIPTFILLDPELTSKEKEQLMQDALDNGTGMVHVSDAVALKEAKQKKEKLWKK